MIHGQKSSISYDHSGTRKRKRTSPHNVNSDENCPNHNKVTKRIRPKLALNDLF